ncbi:MAG: SCO family protein [bacterium]
MKLKCRSSIHHPRSTIHNLLSSIFILILLTAGRTYSQLGASTPPPMLRNVGIEQNLNAPLPLDLIFVNESGHALALREFFGKKPVVLAFVYYECPMLCTQILNGLLESVRLVKFNIGEEYEVLTVSFDPGETPKLAAEKKKVYLQQYDRAGAEKGWHFLTGDSTAIKTLTQAAGFHYRYDPATDQFAHASGILVLTPQGKISKYFYGVEYSPRDLRLALVEAAENKIGSPVDQLLLYCFHYDPLTGKYSFVVINALRIAGIATVLSLATFMFVMLRRDRRAV